MKITWVDKVFIPLIIVSIIGAVVYRSGFESVGSTIFRICFGVAIMSFLYLVYKTKKDYKIHIFEK